MSWQSSLVTLLVDNCRWKPCRQRRNLCVPRLMSTSSRPRSLSPSSRCTITRTQLALRLFNPRKSPRLPSLPRTSIWRYCKALDPAPSPLRTDPRTSLGDAAEVRPWSTFPRVLFNGVRPIDSHRFAADSATLGENTYPIMHKLHDRRGACSPFGRHR